MKDLGKALCAGVLLLSVFPAMGQTGNLTLNIVNLRSEDVWVYFAGNNAPNGTYSGSSILANTSNSDSNGYQLVAGGTLSGFDISEYESGRIFVSVGGTLASGNGSQFNNSSLTDYNSRFDKVEITYFSNPASGASGANLSATDFFGVPFRLQTSTPATGPASVSWTGAYNQALANIINGSVVNQTVNNNWAIVTGSAGVPVGSLGNVVRVIAPSTVAPPNEPFADIGAYVTWTGTTGAMIRVSGSVAGTDYVLSGTVNSAGDVALSGTLLGDPTTMVIDSSFLDAFNIYGANPTSVTFNGVPVASTAWNTSQAAAVRDVYAGFNLGVWGSTEDVNGTPLGDLTSAEFFALGDTTFFFSAAQPTQPTFYNQFAEQLADNSDNSVYGFPYSDVLGGQFIDFLPGSSPIFTLTVLPDAVPEPGVVSLLAGAVLLAAGMRRRNAGRTYG